MGGDVVPKPETLRQEMQALFGLRWDTAVFWAIAGWLSAWAYTLLFRSATGDGDYVGPVPWFADVLHALGVAPPGWLTQPIVWLNDPSRSPLDWVLIAISVVAATVSVRSTRHTGLKAVALVSAAVAIQIEGSGWAAVWVLLLAAMPPVALTVSFIIRLLVRRLDGVIGEREAMSGPYPELVWAMFASRVGFLYLAPILAPVLLGIAMIASYDIDDGEHPALALAREAMADLETRPPATLASASPVTLAALLTAVVMVPRDSWQSTSIAYGLKRLLEQRTIGATRRDLP